MDSATIKPVFLQDIKRSYRESVFKEVSDYLEEHPEIFDSPNCDSELVNLLNDIAFRHDAEKIRTAYEYQFVPTDS
mgnify:CR=1 FL=1